VRDRTTAASTAAGVRLRRRHDPARSVFGERTPYHALGTILGIVGLFTLAFGRLTTDPMVRSLDLTSAVLLAVAGVLVGVLGPRAKDGWPLDVALACAYVLTAYGTTRVADDVSQIVVGYALVVFGVFAALFRPRNRMLMHLVAMLSLYGLALLVRPLTPSPIYFLLVATVTTLVTLMVCVLVQRLREQALHDSLTGVLNRRGLDVMGELISANAARTDTRITLALLDLDGFKSFNDERGHVAGDARLTELAAAWVSHVRSGDLVARYGGDEFVVILPGASESDVDELVARVRDSGQVPFSIGTTSWLPAEDIYAAITRADADLADDKHHRRSQPRPHHDLDPVDVER
jgi:diguanylate cyclase (GGDEF)-like protein